jgi:2-methylisocitrate lyase-like PEP mutase family enzyme
VIPIEDMVAKIKVAVASRESDDFLVIGRTDARSQHGLSEAIRRGQAIAQAGADVVFVEAPESIEEMTQICHQIDRPLIANMVEGGSTPVLSAQQLQEIGFQMAIFPGTAFLAAGNAVESVYKHLKEAGSSPGLETPLYDFKRFSKMMGFDRVWAFEKKWFDQ